LAGFPIAVPSHAPPPAFCCTRFWGVYWARLGSLHALEMVRSAPFWKHWLGQPMASAETVGRVHALLENEGLISGLLAHQIEVLVGEEEAYERAERQAMTLLDQGFHLGGVIRVGRDELHER
jgi:hypothetical protein